MSLKKIVISAFVFGVSLCQLRFMQSATTTVTDIVYTRKCNSKFFAGDCAGLIPAASGCLWAAGKDYGVCIRSKDAETITNAFDLPHN
jgi:hypothetical protein